MGYYPRNFMSVQQTLLRVQQVLARKSVLQLKEDEAQTTTIFTFENADYKSLDETYKTTTDYGWDFTALTDYEDAIKQVRITTGDDYMSEHDEISKHYDPSGKSWPIGSLMDYDPYELNKNLLNPKNKLRTKFDPFWVVRQSFVFGDYEKQDR